jgi:multiple sugar transport system substrate-binding protein
MSAKRAMFVIVCVAMLAACGAQPTPQTLVQTVEVPVQQTVEVPVVQTVEVPVEQTVEVPVKQTVEVPVEQTVIVSEKRTLISFAGHEYFNLSFGPAAAPLDAMKQAVAEKYPNIDIQLLMQPLDANKWHDNLATYFVAQDPTMDLLYVAGYWVTEFGAADWLVPLQDKVSPDLLAKFDSSYLDTFTYNGDLLAVGPSWGGIGGLYYRKDLLDEASLPAPETYDDIIADCDTILQDHPDMGCWDWPAMRNIVLINRWSEYLYGFGGTYMDDSGQCAMNSPEGVAALDYMVNLFKNGYTPQEALSWKEEDSNVRFVSGKTVFFTGRQDLLFWLDDPTRSQIGGKWAFVPNPAQPGGRHSGFTEFWGFGISKFSDNPDEALDVLEQWIDLPVMKDFNLAWGPIQGNSDVYKDPDVIAANQYLPLVQEIAKTALAPLPSANYGEVTDALQAEIHSALSGQKTAQQALDDACTAIDEIDASQ